MSWILRNKRGHGSDRTCSNECNVLCRNLCHVYYVLSGNAAAGNGVFVAPLNTLHANLSCISAGRHWFKAGHLVIRPCYTSVRVRKTTGTRGLRDTLRCSSNHSLCYQGPAKTPAPYNHRQLFSKSTAFLWTELRDSLRLAYEYQIPLFLFFLFLIRERFEGFNSKNWFNIRCYLCTSGFRIISLWISTCEIGCKI